MGLDMYLYRMPRLELPIEQISAIDDYFYFENRAKTDERFYGIAYSVENLSKSTNEIERFRKYAKVYYPSYDTEKAYPEFGIIEMVGYWRKCNAIHRWFVEHAQDGEDDCYFHHEVTREMLEELKSICLQVLDNHEMAEECLPPEGGFLFGSTNISEYYFDTLEKTVAICDKVLNETDFDSQMIYYRSSW